MPVIKMGFEGFIAYGSQGSQAGTQITNCRDEAYEFDTEDGDTTVKGDGSIAPIETSRVVLRRVNITWQMLNKSDDATLAALQSAASTGTPVAIRTKSYSSGLGYDGDCIIKFKLGKPFKGEQTYDFTAKPNNDNRAPSLNS